MSLSDLDSMRQQQLDTYGILDTPPEEKFDEIIKKASFVAQCPYASIAFKDKKRMWLKAKLGFRENDISVEHSFCSQVIQHRKNILISDLKADARFRDNPSVIGEPGFSFYMGVPLFSPQGLCIGTLCVLDTKTHPIRSDRVDALNMLAREVERLLEMRLGPSEVCSHIGLLEEAVRLCPSPIAIVNSGDCFEWINEEWAQLFGCSILEILGHRVPSYFNLVEHSWCQLEVETRCGYRSVQILRQPTSEGRSLIFIKDLTENHNLNQVIERQKLTLLESSRLSDLGQMSANIAHEIRTPLTVVSGIVQLALSRIEKKSHCEDDLIQQLQQIDKMVLKMGRILNSLRSLSRPGQNDPFVRTSIQALALEAAEIPKIKCQKSGVQLQLDLPDHEIVFECRFVQVAQAIGNLLMNALEAVAQCSEKWIVLKIREEADFINITVVDSGEGIAKEIASNIMNPFFTTKLSSNGMGLGLSLSKKIALDHGGDLFMDQESDHTKFILCLKKKHDSISKVGA